MPHRARLGIFLSLFAAGALFLSLGPTGGLAEFQFIPTAHAQSMLQNLLKKLMGETLPTGINKSNGRLEATQVNVSSKYPGRLIRSPSKKATRSRRDRSSPTWTSPEIEAQLRAAQSDVQRAKDALVAAEADIKTRQSAADFAKSEYERGEQLFKTGTISKQAYEQRKRNYETADSGLKSVIAAARPSPIDHQERGSRSRSGPVDPSRPRFGIAAQRARAVSIPQNRRSRRRRRADHDHSRPHRRLHDHLPAGGAGAANWRSAARPDCARSVAAIRDSRDGELRGRGRAIHARRPSRPRTSAKS